ncbi:DEAD/DEAH box helicase [Phytohabitans kaempferiae]|uniref:DEAD/DEAH box helicase n=1 Tax=Phytohabitans kaempferiae TaxID=1620943 RepID=A0ABV6LUN4_9ACTN
MKINNIPYGKAETITLRLLGGNVSSRQIKIGDEVSLRASRADGGVLLRAGTDAWRVDGAEPGDQDLLDTVVDTDLPRITWVSKVGQDGTIVVQVHRFAHTARWDREVVVGIDDDGLRSALRFLPSRRTLDQVGEWLSDQFLIAVPADPHRQPRLLASAGPSQVDSERGFQLHGQTVVANITHKDGRPLLRNVVRVSGRRSRPVALTLVHARIAFRDVTRAAQVREVHRDEFRDLMGSGEQYLNHWDEYSERERIQIVDRALSLGFAPYFRVDRLDSRTFRLHLEPEKGHAFLSRLSDDHTDLEASENAPDGLKDGRLKIDDQGDDAAFSGSVAAVNASACTVSLRVPRDRKFTPPPPTGDVYLSLVGDRVRLGRQLKARRLIETLSTPMPQLGLLLEGTPVRGADVPTRTIQPQELAAFAPYRGFTKKQEAAVRIALNTPDIALIQGPPGTGKTSVITAIQDCLVQLGKEQGTVGHSVLVSSFQHDAVEEVVRRTEVLGLPAVKIGSRDGRDTSEWVREWCERKANALRESLPPSGHLLRATRAVEALAVGYGRQPPPPERTADLVREVESLAGEYLPVALRARLANVRTDLTAAGRPEVAPDELEPLRRAIAAIRFDPVAFADDGPHIARKAHLRLRKRAGIAEEDLALLAEAAGFDGAGPPPFLDRLARLRDRLLDLLAPAKAPLGVTADEEVLDLFGAVVRSLRERLAVSPDGVAAALEQYLAELENDPEAVGEAITRFTAVIAATCQQSSSRAMAEQVSGNHIVFDTVIVDEAARANPLDLMIPLCLAARRVILVGDHRQLPHMLEPDIERELESSAHDEMLAALKQSMFERLFQYLRTAKTKNGQVEREITLDTQFRMHRVLGTFVSRAFYAEDTELGSGPNTDALHHGIQRYGEAVAVWADLSLRRHGPEVGGRSKSRPAEADWIAQELVRLSREAPAAHNFGVIAFYRAQVQAIWTSLEAVGLASRVEGRYQATGELADRLHIGTVDAFQGREFDIVLLSVTRSNSLAGGRPLANRQKYGHLMLTNRLCVAMSRQKRLLIAVGDGAMFDGANDDVGGLVMFRTLCDDRRYGRVLPV